MKSNKEITIFSALAKDRLYYEKEDLIKEQEGGPAYYIMNVFKNKNIRFGLRLKRKIIVDILVNNKGEFGKIINKPKILKVDYSMIKSPYIFISTILNEINLEGMEKFRGKIFLDIQGYVRDGNDFGKKKKWQPPKKTCNAIFCLKATKQEMKFVPKEFIDRQKKKLLIITKGSQGSDLFVSGKKYTFVPSKIVNTINTIGSGDTFFSYFICEYIRSKDAARCLIYATNQTSKFLINKNQLEESTCLFQGVLKISK
jgi:hypothetical protein